MTKRSLSIQAFLIAWGVAFLAPPASMAASRALIVAIAHYAPSTGWPTTAAATDVLLMKKALQAHGFRDEDIHVLCDDAATAHGIVDAFERYLIKDAKPGDVLLFHFSGHGQQITDDGDDEADGYDETIVPWNAPMAPAASYDGSLHLRDDDLGRLMERARRAARPTGNVIAVLDSCFSGTGDRGNGPTVRGGPPIGRPRKGRDGAGDGGGVYQPSAADSGLAPYVFFSAAGADELDEEAYDPVLHSAVGPLSAALSKALLRLRSRTYADLFDDVRAGMRQLRVNNEPQLEGDANTVIFNGHVVRQAPYFPIAEVREDGRVVVLPIGTVGGLLPGATVEIHRPGALKPAAATRLGRGVIESAGALTATVRMGARVLPTTLSTARAFVTGWVFGDTKLRVRVQAFGNAALEARVVDVLQGTAVVERVDRNAEATIALQPASGGASLVVSTTDGSKTFGIGAIANGELAYALEDLARGHYLARLQLDNPDLRFPFDIVPVEVTCVDPAHPRRSQCKVHELDPKPFLSAGNELRLPVGSYFEVRVRGEGKPAYVSLVDLTADGALRVAWPRDSAGARVSANRSVVLDVFRVTEPLGTERFVLIATPWQLDFRPIESRDDKEREAVMTQNPFTFLFENLGQRNLRPILPDTASTFSRQIRVVTK